MFMLLFWAAATWVIYVSITTILDRENNNATHHRSTYSTYVDSHY